MKKLDLVKLINDKPYSKNNLSKDLHGIIVDINDSNVLALFFNPQNIGDYAVVEINKKDIVEEKEKIPENIKNEIHDNLDNLLLKSKDYLEDVKIKEYDLVELLVEEDRYAKFGIHKGDKGCVMDNHAVQDYIEVDFSKIDENGNYVGDCISVKLSDLKVLKD